MKFYLTCLFVVIWCSQGMAQNNYVYINWDINKPLTNTEWVESTSTRGGKVGYRFFFTEHRKFSLGVDYSWTSFEEYAPTQTFVNGSTAITTDYLKFVYQSALAISGQYYLNGGKSDWFFPYAGLGMGVNRNRYVMNFNVYSNEDKTFGFLARPELGLLAKFGRDRNVGVMAAMHYDYASNKSEDFDYKRFTSMGFQVGVFFMNRY
jgi:hypothetical protein